MRRTELEDVIEMYREERRKVSDYEKVWGYFEVSELFRN